MSATGGAPCLVVFARAPVAGRVKTRLFQPAGGAAAALTAEQAAELYAAFIADVCRCGQRSGIARRRLYVAGDLAHPYLAQVARANGFILRAQQGADLGERMGAAIAAELAAGASAVILIGTDSPSLPASYLRHAAALLADQTSIVLGPADDGGYYLIAARQPIPTVFAAGIAWSTDQVLPTTLRRLRELAATGTRFALLPPFYDVDTAHDLRRLAAELRQTDRPAAAPVAEDPGVPTELPAAASYAVLEKLGWL